MQVGWIKLWRKIQDSKIWLDPEPFNKRSAWIDLLLMAWAKEKDFFVGYKKRKLKQGQLFTSYRFLAEKWHWSIGRVQRYLNFLEKVEKIKKTKRETDTGGTLITICKWGVYQGGDGKMDTQTIHKRYTSDTPTIQNKECKRMLKKEDKPSSCSRNSKPEFLERVEKLKSLILQNNPNAKPKTGDWANYVRLMVERDKRTLAEIDEIIEFSQNDDFWKTNVLSMGKLKEQFDQLTVKMKVGKKPKLREASWCPNCKKTMADCGDYWHCTECGAKFPKELPKEV